jgi:hypothetical protein
MTTLANRTVCTSMPDVCITCSNDQNCAQMGPGAVCIPYDAYYCSGLCQSPGPGICVPGVCFDLPSGIAPAPLASPIKEPGPATAMGNSPRHTRPDRDKKERVPRGKKKKRPRH